MNASSRHVELCSDGGATIVIAVDCRRCSSEEGQFPEIVESTQGSVVQLLHGSRQLQRNDFLYFVRRVKSFHRAHGITTSLVVYRCRDNGKRIKLGSIGVQLRHLIRDIKVITLTVDGNRLAAEVPVRLFAHG